MALVAPGVVVALLVGVQDPDVRFRLRQNPWAAPGDLHQCKRNLKNVATALEMYSTDARGRYPPTLRQLVPTYLRTLPTCPSADRVTFAYQAAAHPDDYTMVCEGLNHAPMEQARNYPQYGAVFGGALTH